MTRIGMVCEATSDQKTATSLASRVLGRSIETVCANPEIDSNHTFTCWTKLDRHPQNWPRYHLNGHRGNGEPLHGQTLAARKAILIFNQKVDAIILMVDGDDEFSDRRKAMERARVESTAINPDRIVIAVPRPEREAWHIIGFEPTEEEQEIFREVRSELGFDPRLRSHQLKHGKDQAKRNAKRVLDALTNGSLEREQSCVIDTSLETLRERGEENGLCDFLGQLSRLAY